MDGHLAAGVGLEGEEAGEQRGLEVEDRAVVGHKPVQHQEALPWTPGRVMDVS